MSEPAGWYANPDGTDSERFWDGSRWTHDVRPVPGKVAPPPPMHHDEGTVASILHGDPLAPSHGGAGMPEPPVEAGVAPPPMVEAQPEGPGLGGPVTDLFRVLFDFSFRRPLTPEVAASIYRLAAIATLVVIALLLAMGLLAGGVGAILSLLLWPTVGLLSLVHLRAVLQAAAGIEAGEGATLQTADPDPVDPGIPGMGAVTPRTGERWA